MCRICMMCLEERLGEVGVSMFVGGGVGAW